MLLLYALALFSSAALLFVLEPMFAKLALPLLGGSPSVWTTCMLFFQAALLAGYGYVHLTSRWLRVRTQIAVHVAVLALPAIVLPIGLHGWVPPVAHDPTLWLLGLLAACVGLPFFAVACSAPLLQRWFGLTSHRSAADPYFLYASSNAGSLLGLLAYPTLIEPWIGAAAQSRAWTLAYAALAAATLGCGALVWNRPGARLAPVRLAGAGGSAQSEPIDPWRRAKWVVLAAVPSSLMLGVTTFVSTDIAVVPLLWVVPLALYLLSFVLVFARRRLLPDALVRRALPIAVSLSLALLVLGAVQPAEVVVPVHLLTLFLACMACHGRLADDRPPLVHLPEFYLWLGFGGVLGGAFNALVAPLVFTQVSEYPLAIALVCLLASRAAPGAGGEAAAGFVGRPAQGPDRVVAGDVVWPLAVGAVCVGLLIAARRTGETPSFAINFLNAALPVGLAFLASSRPLRFGLTVALVLLVGRFNTFDLGRELAAYRTFYGVHRIMQFVSPRHGFAVNALYNGGTLHGSELIDPSTHAPVAPTEPLAYYNRQGPIGDVMSAWSGRYAPRRVGLVGLGAGALAAYAGPGQHFTYFELDPTVARIASDPHWFRYLSAARARGARVDVVLGDARLSLREAHGAKFDMLVLDAFSSDTLPLHLLSREAIQLYLRRLAPGGVIAFHLSNRHLDLEPEMAAVAADLHLVAIARYDHNPSPLLRDRIMRRDSRWLLMARSLADLHPLAVSPRAGRWRRARIDPGLPVWTDDYSNVFRIFIW